MLLFHIFNTETIDRSIVSYYLTGNVTLFRGILMPCPDWINVLYLFHGHVYAISPVIHNDCFGKVDFNINLHGDYKSYENF
jgi:hypothetical protein